MEAVHQKSVRGESQYGIAKRESRRQENHMGASHGRKSGNGVKKIET